MESVLSLRVSDTIHVQMGDQIISESRLIMVIPMYFHIFTWIFKFMNSAYKNDLSCILERHEVLSSGKSCFYRGQITVTLKKQAYRSKIIARNQGNAESRLVCSS